MKSKRLSAVAWFLFPATLILHAQNSIHITARLESPTQVLISWDALAGKSYQLETTTDLRQPWQVLPTTPAILLAYYSVPVEAGVRFFRVVKLDIEPPVISGLVWIPAGSFQMGDSFNEGIWHERPVHKVHVSAFYMDKYEVTKALWDEVYQWAISHEYQFDYAGSGKATNHPVHTINWNDVVKWSNARSEKEGRVPAYYTNAAQTAVYRTGQVKVRNDWVKWDAGYRLPTEAEWEKAARGGTSGRRFPWADADTITHSRADYYSDSSHSYDVSSTRGYHVTFNDGVWPYTSPVGWFAPNGYGLYDMAGNVWEWCWDWYGSSYYGSLPGSDPRGPDTGSFRVIRGGDWHNHATYCRTAYRNDFWPDLWNYYIGFRSVLPPGQ